MTEDQKKAEQHTDNTHIDAQSILIVAVETALSYVIKNDRVAKSYSTQFERMALRVQFNTYYPSARIIATFDKKGLLLDWEQAYTKSEKAPDMIIYVSMMDLIRILLLGDNKRIRNLRIGGKTELHQDFKAFLISITLPAVLSDWRNLLSMTTGSEVENKTPRPTAKRLVSQIELQRKHMRKLEIRAKGYKNDYLRLKHRHRMLSIAYWVVIVAMAITIFVLAMK
ncbi:MULTISPECIES: hypothetical protein [unclassified Acinetobacter]|uniref:hypothetical protein n=1 Tax=unclassified Acinetobacter TaxID=196816 RepID=UPI0035B84C9D